MKKSRLQVMSLALCVSALLLGSLPSMAAEVAPSQDQIAMLASKDLALAANKRLVFNFWREVIEGGHIDLANKYLDESYVQHNPNVPTGRTGFIKFFSQFAKPVDIAPTIKAPVISIVAEGDLVVLTFRQPMPDANDKSKSYETTWFDMFRVKNGKLVEHWDPALKDS